MSQRIYQIPLEWKKKHSLPYLAVVLQNILSDEECDSVIRQSEKVGYEMALVNVGGGKQQKLTDVRNNDRCIIDDPEFAEVVWQRILSAIATDPNLSSSNKDGDELMLEYGLDRLGVFQHRGTWYSVGLNERLRILRYGPGTYFAPHYDGSYLRTGNDDDDERNGECSFATILLYLNDCPMNSGIGGTTNFICEYDETRKYQYYPKKGDVLLFQHHLLHEGAPLLQPSFSDYFDNEYVKPIKYVLRTDVMYSKKGPGNEYSKKPIKLANNKAPTIILPSSSSTTK